MKITRMISMLLLCLFLTGCVQKSYKKTVVFTLDVSGINNIKKVGVRGNDKPLSWDNDAKMEENKREGIYKITTTFETGYKCTEIKFVVNDIFEFQNEANRRILFSEKDTTFFKAKFNER